MSNGHMSDLRTLTPGLADPSHDYTVRSWLPVPGWSHERDHIGEARAWWRSRRSKAG